MTSRKRKQTASHQESPQLLEIIGELKEVIAQQTRDERFDVEASRRDG